MFGFLVKCGGGFELSSRSLPFVNRPVRCLSEMFKKFSKFRERLDADEETFFQDLVSFRYHVLRR